MSTRRQFVKKTALLTSALSLIPFAGDLFARTPTEGEPLPEFFNFTGDKDPENDEYWKLVRQAYTMPEDFGNLESGYFNPQPGKVISAEILKLQLVNNSWSHYMRTNFENEKKDTVKKLAAFAGVGEDEIIIQRNTTEALNTIISGLEFAQGDEIIYADLDYPNMRAALLQKEQREKIVLKKVILPLSPQNKKEIVDIFEKAITKKTKLIHLTHAVYLNGLILPVKEVCQMAHKHNVEVLVDAAHSFAHINYKISDLECDYFGTSLHKWLAAPLGNGLLYVKKDKISKVWPLMGDMDHKVDEIIKFDRLGTVCAARLVSIRASIEFQENIGLANKEARLKYLKNYWTSKVKDLPGIVMNSPTNDEFSCGIANVGIEGKEPKEICDYLFDKHKVYTVPINAPEVKGVRVTPNVFTLKTELDRLVKGFEELCGK